MKKFAKFWKAANFRLKFGLIVTMYRTRTRSRSIPTRISWVLPQNTGWALPVWVRTLCGC